ncbi:MAG: ATP-dependent Clp protease ATP-binding subunit [Clostridiales bacterium]|nr:ATP-dependent Clp protease ATP-binding subunit [Clostridiales bacterium]
MLCSRCKKRMAVVFMSRMEGNETINEGLCLKCAKELGIPQVSSMMDSMGITDDDIEEMSNQLMELGGDDFEMGGADTMPPFLQNIFGGMGDLSKKSDIPEKDPASKDKKREKGKEQKKNKFLDSYCINLTEKARSGNLDRIIGRDTEIARAVQILNRRVKNNPCLIGEPGVGKTAIVEGIALKIAAGQVPFRLQDKEIYLLDMTSLVSGTQFRGQFESRIKGLIDDIKSAKNVILFIDEVHTLVGAGSAEGSMDAANILKPSLSRGDIQVIGATTFDEYRKHIEKDSALERRFQPITVNEPTIAETTDVLLGVKSYYEAFHKIKISDNIVRLSVKLSERYIIDRFLPDKAIDLLDEACSHAALRSKELASYEKLNQKLKEMMNAEEQLESDPENIDYEKLAEIKSNLIQTKEELKKLEPVVADIQLTKEDLAKVIEMWTGIPAAKIEQSEYGKISELESHLKAKVIGQDEAVSLVVAAVKRSRVQLNKRKRPASFIFVGPTGVGKTELVKCLADELFETTDPLIRFDMSEFMEKHAVSRLVGAPPGYVGYEEAGQLTERVRRKPYSVVLFDEIEKAHPDVMNILLQILDEGKVTDAQGRTVSFQNTVIVMTSNAGSSYKSNIVGFNKQAGEMAKEKAMRALQEILRPELLGRVDEIVVFSPLSQESMQKIAGLMLDEMKEPLKEQNIEMNYDEKALANLAQHADGGKFGARELRKVIRKKVEDRIANMIVDHYDDPITMLGITADENDIQIIAK